MKRRDFTSGLAAGVTLAAAGGVAVASETGHDLWTQGDGRALRLRLASGVFVTVLGFFVGGRGLRWSGWPACYDEARLDVSQAGGMFRPVFRNRWAEGRDLGAVELVGDALVARAVGDFGGYRVTVGAGSVSWDLPRAPWALAAPQGSGARIGALRMGADDRLLVRLDAEPGF